MIMTSWWGLLQDNASVAISRDDGIIASLLHGVGTLAFLCKCCIVVGGRCSSRSHQHPCLQPCQQYKHMCLCSHIVIDRKVYKLWAQMMPTNTSWISGVTKLVRITSLWCNRLSHSCYHTSTDAFISSATKWYPHPRILVVFRLIDHRANWPPHPPSCEQLIDLAVCAQDGILL